MITRFTLSDLLGWVLVLVALTFIAWRSRYHFIHSEYWKAVNCPKCGSALHRIHRTSWDRFLPHGCPARRYRCKNLNVAGLVCGDAKKTNITGATQLKQIDRLVR
jgi:hypothetical protein